MRSPAAWESPIETLSLPTVLDLKAASQLQQEFLAKRGGALQVDGSKVERIGGLCLQVILAAHAAWLADGQDLVLAPLSAELQAGLVLLGVSPDMLTQAKG
ncbi:STAS domain-containing protein [Acidisoma sp. 7E03]